MSDTYPRVLHKLARRGTTTKLSKLFCKTHGFPQNPQSQQQQDIYITSNIEKNLVVVGPVESKGKVGKLKELSELSFDKFGPGFKDGIGCERQVFSETGIKFSVSSFKSMGYEVKPVKCKKCGLIHLEGIPT